MAFSGNNQSLYNSALNGALAGMLAGRPLTDATALDYATMCNVAQAFAAEVDSLIVADATLTNAGATVVPATAANQQNFNAKSHLIFALSFGYWNGRYWGADVTKADYATWANAIAAVYSQTVTTYGTAAGGTSLS